MNELPPGFVLDGSPSSGSDDLPPGFTLDSGETPSMLGQAHQEGMTALKSSLSDVGNALNPAGKKPEDYQGLSGMLRSAREVGSGLLGGATALAAYPMAAATSLGANLLSPALRGTEGAIASGVENLSPDYAASLRKNIPTEEQAYEALKPGVGAALSGVAASPLSRRLPVASAAEIPTTKQLLGSYGEAKRAPELAAEISPESAASNIGTIRAKLKDELRTPTSARDTHDVLTQLEELGNSDSPLTMGHLHSANERLNEIIKGGGSDAGAALTTKPMLDQWVKGLAETGGADAATAAGIMQDSRANYSVGKAAEGLDKRLATAERKPTSAQMQTAMRTKVSEFLSSRDSQNLTLSQRAALDDFAKGTATQSTLSFLGKSLGGSGGGLPATVAAALGFSAGGLPGLAVPVVGVGLNKLSAALTVRQANKLSELIRSESPLAKQMQGPMTDFSKAAQAAEGSPSARNLAALMLASRNLSNNLKDVDIHIAPNDLMKSLFGKPAEADETKK